MKVTWEVGQFFAEDRWAGGEEVQRDSLAAFLAGVPGGFDFPSLKVFELRL